MMPGRLHVLFGLVALSMVLASAPLARADDERAKMLKAFRAAEKRIDNLYTKCDECKGRGVVEQAVDSGLDVIGTKPRKRTVTCPTCRGERRMLPRGRYRAFLDRYLAYCELIEEYGGRLRQPKNEKLNNQVYARQSKRADFIRKHLGVYESAHGVRDHVYTELARKLILRKSSHVGRAIAFEAVVSGYLKHEGEQVVEVVIVNAKVPHVTCYVVAPSVGWASGAKARVIGKVVDPATLWTFPRGETVPPWDTEPDAVLVKTYPGTE